MAQIVTIDSEIIAAPRLLECLGRKTVLGFQLSHPLARGFRLLMAPPESPDWHQVRRVMEVELFARAVVSHLAGTIPDHKWIRNIRNEHECQAMIFEALVLKQIVEPRVHHAIWTRYDDGVPDILGFTPDVQFECTRIGGGALAKMMRRATAPEKLSQGIRGIPYVIVVGTNAEQSEHPFYGVTDELRVNWDQWMGRHREVSAVLLTAPRGLDSFESIRSIDDEHLALDCGRNYATWARNLSAALPMPNGFEHDVRN